MSDLMEKAYDDNASKSVAISIAAAGFANTLNSIGVDEKLFEDIFHEDTIKVVECIKKFYLSAEAYWENIPDDTRCKEVDLIMKVGINRLKQIACQIEEYDHSRKSIIILMIFLYSQLFMRPQITGLDNKIV